MLELSAMRKTSLLLPVAILSVACGTIAQTPSTGLDWLAGCWVSADGSTTEHWTLATWDHAFGSSVTVSDDAVAFFEFMQIEPTDDGYVFSAYPRGSGPNPFPLESAGPQSVTFANAEHDYPQRIAYERQSDELHARISKMDGSDENRWAYRACER